MSTIYTKPPVVPAWGETNTTAEDMVQPPIAEISTGWPYSTTPPSRQYFNWLLNFLATGVRYFCQRGLPDWDPAETYQHGSVVIGDDSQVYRSLVDQNVNAAPSASPGNWAVFSSGGDGLTIQEVEAAQLTQPNPAQNDNSQRVATTSWVTTAINIAAQAVSTALNNSINALTNRVAADEAQLGKLNVNMVSNIQNQLNTGYVNNTTVARFVGVYAHAPGGGVGGTLTALVDGQSIASQSAESGANSAAAYLFFLVPAGKTYQVNTDNLVKDNWTEWS